MVTEFGVLRHHSDPIDRARWYRDVRVHLENRDVPWMIWSDLGGFGFDFETESFETRILVALGLLPGSIESPKISVGQGSVSPGTRITASATGFTPSSTVRLNLSGIDVASGRVTSDGTAQLSFRVPNLTTGKRSLKVFAEDGLKASTPLTIDPVARVEPSTAHAGSPIRVRLYGFSRQEPVTLSFRQGTRQIRLVRVVVDTTGTRGVTITVPATATIGAATIIANGQSGYATVTLAVSGLNPSTDPTATTTPTVVPSATITTLPSATATNPVEATATPELLETATLVVLLTETPTEEPTAPVEASPIE